jgi:CheY-like chemotaxis protein
MRLLIVEDNATIRRMIKSIVKDLAEDICECSDGSEALAAYRERQPDWVLMDIKMNETDGLAATRQIRAAFPDANIVMVTNYDEADLREAARAAGARAYVVKEDLFALRDVLGKRERKQSV